MTPGERLVTVREGTDLETAKQLMHRHRLERVLVVDDERNLRGLITVKDIQKSTEHPIACKDDLGRLRVGAAIGVASDNEARGGGAGRGRRGRASSSTPRTATRRACSTACSG